MEIFPNDYVLLNTGMMFKVVTCNRFIDIIVVAGCEYDFEILYEDVAKIYREVK